MPRSVVRSVGAYAPPRIVTNDELSQTLDTSDEWIRTRTGIQQRHIADEGVLTSDLAVEAAKVAMTRAGMTATDIDGVVVATSTPDNTFPASATAVQRKLGMRPGTLAFDVQAVCAGFVYAVSVADNMIRVGQARRLLVIGAETFSRLMDWEDRNTCVLFGDGAGALVLEAGTTEEEEQGRGILACRLHADGAHYDRLYVDGGVAHERNTGCLRMDGREIFKLAVPLMSQAVLDALDDAGEVLDHVDVVVPHQANQRILDAMVKKMRLAPEKMISTVVQYANTSAASIPLALDVAFGDGRLQEGQLVALTGIGGGIAWGGSVIRW